MVDVSTCLDEGLDHGWMTFHAGEVERGYALAVSRLNVRVGSSSEENADHTNMALLGGRMESRATPIIGLGDHYRCPAVTRDMVDISTCLDESLDHG